MMKKLCEGQDQKIRSSLFMLFLLCLGTILFFTLYEPYQVVGDDLISNNNFNKGFKDWEIMGEASLSDFKNQVTVNLVSEDGPSYSAVSQIISNIDDYNKLKFSGVLKTQNIIRGEEYWRAARLVLVGLDSLGRPQYQIPHVLISLDGTNEWGRYSRIFKVNKNVSKFIVGFQLPNVQGVASLKEISLRPVNEKLPYKYYWGIALLLWIALGIRIFSSYMNAYSLFSRQYILYTLMVLLIAFSVLVPMYIKESAGEWLYSSLSWIKVIFGMDDGSGIGMYRVGHFTLFFLISWLMFRCVKSWGGGICMFMQLVLFALASETSQFFTGDRAPMVFDFIADVSGISIVMMFWALWYLYKQNCGSNALND